MRTIALTAACVGLLAACSAGETSQATGQSGDASQAQMTNEGLAAIERRRLQAFVAGDWETLDALHAEDFELVNPQGAVWNKAQYVGSQEDGGFRYLTFEPVGEIRASAAGDAGAVRYRSKLSVQVGEVILPEANYRHTDYYEKRDGRWQVVFSQATPEQLAE